VSPGECLAALRGDKVKIWNHDCRALVVSNELQRALVVSSATIPHYMTMYKLSPWFAHATWLRWIKCVGTLHLLLPQATGRSSQTTFWLRHRIGATCTTAFSSPNKNLATSRPAPFRPKFSTWWSAARIGKRSLQLLPPSSTDGETSWSLCKWSRSFLFGRTDHISFALIPVFVIWGIGRLNMVTSC